MTDGDDLASGVALASAPRQYAARLTAGLAAVLGRALAAAYLHGSAALGGWVAARSDVDMLVVVADDVAEPAVATAADLLTAPVDCPGRGLECSVVTASQAARPAPPWPFVLHVGSGHFGHGPVLVRGAARAGDADLLMHYAVCRAAGIALAGQPPEAVIGPVGRELILAYLADELAWGLANAPESYAVLNACRALVFADEDRIVSKVAGGLAILERGSGQAGPAGPAGPAGTTGLIRRALDQQRGRAPERPAGQDAITFVERVAALIRMG